MAGSTGPDPTQFIASTAPRCGNSGNLLIESHDYFTDESGGLCYLEMIENSVVLSLREGT
jgi:hypothetical protein